MDNEELNRLKRNFSEIGLNDWLIKQCDAVGMKNPTSIQLNCVPKILEGRDCIGCAKTGSGKTAAFALPILQKLSEDPYGVFALVLTPTRELAFQISEQFSVLGKPIGLRVSVVTGGRDMVMQGSSLSEKPHILVSTPGRLADHIETGTEISLSKIRFLVLDEADRLLEDNFGEQLKTIFKILPKKRQTLLFSATMTESIRTLQETSEEKPFYFSAIKDIATVETLEQQYVLMPADVKDAYLLHMVNKFQEENEKSLIIVFTHTCKYCQLLGLVMKDLGLECVTLHSMIPQRDRLAALAKFKSHQVRTLIATDVASRGLDIPAVDFIINFNVPTRAKDYVHRVGRTARAGRGGFAVTLVTQFDIKLFQAVESHIKTKLTEMKVNESEVAKIATEVAVSKRKAEIRLDEVDFGESKEIHLRKKLILEGKDPEKYLEKKRKRKNKKFKGNKKKKV
ncbi:DgyrCDS8279 [Dimorphilus gyrociliatus]|uniref:RNA helicase n=1 Tax=Dimorphilus gyrociliatus TaxID=2664684 RepID=A0A7I8VV91_9ANNE|nr:DgyrCDS8279 [Dimorphilus gyrociliatus]